LHIRTAAHYIAIQLLSGKEVVYVIYKVIMVSSNLYSTRKTLNTSTSIIIDILELGIGFFLIGFSRRYFCFAAVLITTIIVDYLCHHLVACLHSVLLCNENSMCIFELSIE